MWKFASVVIVGILACCPATTWAQPKDEPADKTRTVLPMSDRSFAGLMADGFEVRTSVTGLVVLQRPGKPLPVYFCEVAGVEGRGLRMSPDKPGKDRRPELVISGCFEQAGG